MKKTLLTTMLTLFAAFAATAGTTTISYGTKGPDTYADGTPVITGEFYALVWTATTEFGGFNADATLKNPDDKRLALVANARLNTKTKLMSLGTSQLTITDAIASQFTKSGYLHVVLLDTRNADGTLSTPTVNPDGTKVPSAINGYDVKGYVSVAAKLSGVTSVSEQNALSISIESAIPDETFKSPVVKSIRFEGEGDARKMVMVVTNTASYLRYTSGDVTIGSPSMPKTQGAVPSNGGATPNAEIEVTVPAADANTNRLFRIIRNSVIN